MKISRTLKISGIVFLLSFIPIAILGLVTWEDFVWGHLLYTFLLMAGFIGVPIYLLTLLFGFLIAKKKDKDIIVNSIWKYVLIVNIIILIAGLIASKWSVGIYYQEYLVLNLVATLITILIPYVHNRIIKKERKE